MKYLFWISLVFAVAACSSEAGGGGSAPAPPVQGRWDCEKDEDCVNSCKLGAVSRTWYDKNQGSFIECEDGCDNQISGPPRCVGGQCAAFDDEGKPRPYCTRKTD